MLALIRPALAGAAILAATISPGSSHDYKAGPLILDHPWSRATPGGAKVAVGYLRITNTGAESDRLVGGTSPLAARVEVHEMSTTDGVMRMRTIEDGLEIRPGGTVELKPGSFHLMFQEIRQPLKAKDRVPATLTFQRAGTVEVLFNVEPIGAGAPAGSHEGMTHDAAAPGRAP